MIASKLFVLFGAAAAVSGLVIPRTTPPAGWWTEGMENYDEYHTRYLALQCQNKHDTDFFDKCCHPMKADETLETARAPECNPANTANPSASPAPSSTPVANVATGDSSVDNSGDNGEDDDDEEYCDEDDDNNDGSSDAPAASTPSPAPAPAENVAPAPSPSPSPSPPAPAQDNNNNNNNGGGVITGGFATFFYQQNTAGACGNVNSDDTPVVAIDSRRWGDLGQRSDLCGKQVEITNTDNGKKVTATIADACPTCQNENCLDLSTGAFNAIADSSQGMVPISWKIL